MPPSARSFLSFGKAAVPGEDPPRLYCFAYAGGSSSIYAAWARALTPAIAVLGVEMPGHGSRFEETPLSFVSDMATDAANAIEASGSRAPYVFYGHSLGALVAFETARLLQQRAAAAPVHLFAGAARAPHLPAVVAPVSHLATAEFLAAVQQRYGGLPAALFEEPELLEMVLPVLRADFAAYENYAYTHAAHLRTPITVFHGTSDPVVRRAAVSEWSHVTDRAFRLQEIEGDHFFLNTSRDLLLQHIREGFEQGAGALDGSSHFSISQ